MSDRIDLLPYLALKMFLEMALKKVTLKKIKLQARTRTHEAKVRDCATLTLIE